MCSVLVAPLVSNWKLFIHPDLSHSCTALSRVIPLQFTLNNSHRFQRMIINSKRHATLMVPNSLSLMVSHISLNFLFLLLFFSTKTSSSTSSSSSSECPVFAGMTNFIELFAGASIEAAQKLNQGQYDVAINWSGGLHHARKEEASGCSSLSLSFSLSLSLSSSCFSSLTSF